MYEYKAKVVKVYDADTLTVDIDLGFGVWVRNQKIRLFGINAYEVRRNKRRGIDSAHVKKGKEARLAVIGLLLQSDFNVKIKTQKDSKGKYGRWLADVAVYTGNHSPINLSLWLVERGHAWYQKY